MIHKDPLEIQYDNGKERFDKLFSKMSDKLGDLELQR